LALAADSRPEKILSSPEVEHLTEQMIGAAFEMSMKSL
jgi:hypothetical protein